MSTPIRHFLSKVAEITAALDESVIEKMVEILVETRAQQGRLFCIGSGGGAGHASHAVCDFRKLCGLEAYCPSDNVSELTARTNDEGWATTLSEYLKGSRLRSQDCVMVFSVGGGSLEPSVSPNLVEAVRLARERGARVVGVAGRDGGYLAQHSDACLLIPSVDSSLITPLTEGFQAVIWHLLVSHPALQAHTARWESLQSPADPEGKAGRAS